MKKERQIEERKQLRLNNIQSELEAKRRRSLEREEQRKKHKADITRLEDERKNEILNRIEITESIVKQTKKDINRKRKKKAYSVILKLQDKEDNIRRMVKKDEYRREKLRERIEMRNEYGLRIKQEKEALAVSRQRIRKELDIKRHSMINEFEHKKRRWQSSNKQLLICSTLMESNNITDLSFKDQNSVYQSIRGEGQVILSDKKISKEDAIEVVNTLRATLNNELMEILSKQEQIRSEQEENLRNVLIVIES